eukprot:2226034-Amphidinium_carterae.1
MHSSIWSFIVAVLQLQALCSGPHDASFVFSCFPLWHLSDPPRSLCLPVYITMRCSASCEVAMRNLTNPPHGQTQLPMHLRSQDNVTQEMMEARVSAPTFGVFAVMAA